jgi:hydroxyacylglutathione hydrolase
MQLHAIPIFSDNYVWMLVHGTDAVAVDPGDAAPVARYLQQNSLNLAAILVTHHHPDHIAGIRTLLDTWPVEVYGPAAESATIRLLSRELHDGDVIEVLGERLQVVSVPGHTLGHIAFVQISASPGEVPFALCGDTLFSAGCGRLFEGTPGQMHHSLQKLNVLPPATRLYCTHEYTLSNLAFAQAVEPDNGDIRAHIAKVRQLREEGQASVPTSLTLERHINPFLRTAVPAVRRAAEIWSGGLLSDETAVFAALRKWKDGFRAP